MRFTIDLVKLVSEMFNEICYFTIIIVQSNRRLQAKALSSDRLRNIIIIMIMIMIIIIIIIIVIIIIIIDSVTFSRPAVCPIRQG